MRSSKESAIAYELQVADTYTLPSTPYPLHPNFGPAALGAAELFSFVKSVEIA